MVGKSFGEVSTLKVYSQVSVSLERHYLSSHESIRVLNASVICLVTSIVYRLGRYRLEDAHLRFAERCQGRVEYAVILHVEVMVALRMTDAMDYRRHCRVI